LFTPPYPYTLDSAESVKASVMAGAGAGQAAQLWLEAEDATLQSPFIASSDPNASGNHSIESTQSSTQTAPTSGHVTYTNTLSGTAAVWLRIYCPSGSADSFWVKYGGGSFANFFNTTGVYGSWIWVKWGQVPASGTLTLASREAATRLDRVLFTNDLSFTPSALGPLNTAPAHENLLQELVGFGRHTSGGKGGGLYTVTSLADSGPGTLREALTGAATPLWIRFGVSGTIPLSSEIVVQSNKTIDGRGADITLSGHGLSLQNGASNLIVNNIKLTNIAGDALRLYNGSRRMWVHHCDISNTGDGAFDATENVDEVTMSYTHIFNQDKALLIGAGSDTGDGAGLHWTAHHNWYQNVTQRLPLLRMGKAHSYNNLFNWLSGTAIVSAIAPAQFLSENDILEPLNNVNHKLILVQNGGASSFQGAWQKPYAGGTLNLINTGTVFEPHAEYAYTPDVANSALEAHIEANAGWKEVPWPAAP
jgi:pectate lyase